MSWNTVKARRISRSWNQRSIRERMGVVASDVEELVALQVQVAVEGLGKHLMGSYQGAKGPGAQGDGGEEIKVHGMG
jgi:hypothetical protein